jgi:REP element-mobilizing transposase RayT
MTYSYSRFLLILLPSINAQTGPVTQPRKRLVSYSDTVYYHCIARCVRRAFLCGKDPLTGYDFEHRRQWIVDRLHKLSSVFAIDLCAYAVMNNHYHVVVRANLEKVAAWTDEEIAAQWCRLFRGPESVQRWMKGYRLDAAERDQVQKHIDLWRHRLVDLSWFMRCLNESIARMANQEDGCTGRFWEGRFKSQALLDERALLACMAYVDLNPIRADIAQTPEQSDYTSIKERIVQPDGNHLRSFSATADDAEGIPFTLESYLELVDWAGRVVQSGKRGAIPGQLPPILTRLGMSPLELTRFLVEKQEFPRAIGPIEQMRRLAKAMGGHFFKGATVGRRLCPTPV